MLLLVALPSKILFHDVRSDEMQQQKMLVECTDENILKDLKNP